jgi:phage shock protein A
VVILGRARTAVRTARVRLSPRGDDTAVAGESTSSQEVARLQTQLRRNQKALARLRTRLTALEEEVSETRRMGLQVGQLGDLVATLLARQAADPDGDLSRDLSTYADDL